MQTEAVESQREHLPSHLRAQALAPERGRQLETELCVEAVDRFPTQATHADYRFLVVHADPESESTPGAFSLPIHETADEGARPFRRVGLVAIVARENGVPVLEDIFPIVQA